jgi:hypothetical protein
VWQIVGEAISEFDFDNICNSVSIFLNDHIPRLVAHEGVDLRFKIGVMPLCTTKHALRTFEDVSHGKDG